jgi:hypothetical protein
MRFRIAAVAALLALGLAAPAIAQTSSENPQTVTGSVVSSSDTTLVIRTDDGTTRTYVVDSNSAMPSTALSAGNRVTVLYRPLDATRFSVVSVAPIGSTTSPAGQAPPPSATSATPSSTAPGSSPDPNMPSTAGSLPLAGLAALALLAGGFALRAFAR